ncbi:MAG: hypothetical protein JJV93_00855 [Alphaproteobacteria bacterium]|nr:hypothetical protein [Alphaproteobacteria bacterium]
MNIMSISIKTVVLTVMLLSIVACSKCPYKHQLDNGKTLILPPEIN